MARRRIARVTDDWLRLLGSDDALPAVPVGSDAWFAWLEEPGHHSFSYAGPSGTFTARRERRHGRSYWYAYRTRDGELRKEYLGLTEALTPERLAGAAANLADLLATEATLTAEPGPIAESSRSAAPSSAPGVPHVLATKLFVPRPRPDLVARPRLLARLDAGLESSRCTLLSAPAGAGKTTLLAAWLAAAPCPVAWLASTSAIRMSTSSCATSSPRSRPSRPPSARRRWPGSTPRRLCRFPRSCSPTWSTTWRPCPGRACWSSTTTIWFMRRPSTRPSPFCWTTCRRPSISSSPRVRTRRCRCRACALAAS